MKTKWTSFFPALLVIALCGCSPQVITMLVGDYEAIPVDSVVVLGKQDPVPEAAEKLGWVQVGNTGFTRDAAGTPRAVMTIAKDKAAAKGGNVLKVTEHWPPDWNSTTHRIQADVYRMDDIGDLPSRENEYRSDEIIAPDPPAPAWRLHVIGGYGACSNPFYLLGSFSPADPSPYFAWGVSYGAGVHRYLRNIWGVGLCMRGHYSPPGRNFANPNNILFVGPVISERFFSPKHRHAFIADFGVGYLGWREDRTAYKQYQYGWNIGCMIGLGYELALTRHLAAYLDLTYVFGYLTRYSMYDASIKYAPKVINTTKLARGRYFGVSYEALSLGLRLNL